MQPPISRCTDEPWARTPTPHRRLRGRWPARMGNQHRAARVVVRSHGQRDRSRRTAHCQAGSAGLARAIGGPPPRSTRCALPLASGLLLRAVGTAVALLAGSTTLLLPLAVVAGTGGMLVRASLRTVAATAFDGEERRRTNALTNTTMGVTSMAGPALGGAAVAATSPDGRRPRRRRRWCRHRRCPGDPVARPPPGQ